MTNLNHCSSRSHTIFTLKIKSFSKKEGIIRKASVNFVDLAGSEKLSTFGYFDEDVQERDYLRYNN